MHRRGDGTRGRCDARGGEPRRTGGGVGFVGGGGDDHGVSHGGFREGPGVFGNRVYLRIEPRAFPVRVFGGNEGRGAGAYDGVETRECALSRIND